MPSPKNKLTEPLRYGKYILLERLSSGGMSEVFRAKVLGPEGFSRTVAIKRILPNYSDDAAFVDMFIDEAKISARLHHPNICQIYNFGRINDSHFLAMEYVAGQALRSLIRRHLEQRLLLPTPVVLYIVTNLCDALHYAHKLTDDRGKPLGIVHRDIKPQNILIGYQGEVKLIDFGIAKAAGRLSVTHGDGYKGTWNYMSPEQAQLDPLDNRTDIFSMGLILHELLSGQPVFPKGAGPGVLDLVRKAEIPPPSQLNPSVPEELEAIVMRAVARESRDRFQSAGEMQQALSAFEAQSSLRSNQQEMAQLMERVFAAELDSEQVKSRRFAKLLLPDGDVTQLYNEQPQRYFEDVDTFDDKQPTPQQAVEGVPGFKLPTGQLGAEGDQGSSGNSSQTNSSTATAIGFKQWLLLLVAGSMLAVGGVVVGILLWAHRPDLPEPGETAPPSPRQLQPPVEDVSYKPPGELIIKTNPSGAKLTIFSKGRPLPLPDATSPLAISTLQSGERYLIRVTHEGYVPREREIVWAAGSEPSVKIELQPLPTTVAVGPRRAETKRPNRRRRSPPASAAAAERPLRMPVRVTDDLLDSNDATDLEEEEDEPAAQAGNAPLAAHGQPSQGTAAATAPPRAADLPPPQGKTPAAPKPPPPPPKPPPPPPNWGILLVSSGIVGYVFVDGKNTGQLTPARLKLPVGEHEVVVVLRQGGDRIRYVVQIKPGKTHSLRLKGAK